jgi:antibiotic biosynthesis monooxygenase (ABM) superfamily enzyme
LPWQEYVSRDEAHFGYVAERVPGFSGFYFDDQGNLVAWLTEPSRSAELEALLDPFLRSRPTHARAGWSPARWVIVRQGDYDGR